MDPSYQLEKGTTQIEGLGCDRNVVFWNLGPGVSLTKRETLGMMGGGGLWQSPGMFCAALRVFRKPKEGAAFFRFVLGSPSAFLAVVWLLQPPRPIFIQKQKARQTTVPL